MTGGLALIWPVMAAAFLARWSKRLKLSRSCWPSPPFAAGDQRVLAFAGLAVLALIVAVLEPLLGHVPLRLLQFVIGVLLLLFGMHWLRKAILRAAGVIPLHDEATAFATKTAELREQARRNEARLDWIAALTTFKAVVLEGLEVVFIVIALLAALLPEVPLVAGGILLFGCLATLLSRVARANERRQLH